MDNKKTWTLTVRLTEFSVGEIEIESEDEPNFIQTEEYVRRNFDNIKFHNTDENHWRVTHIDGKAQKKEEK